MNERQKELLEIARAERVYTPDVKPDPSKNRPLDDQTRAQMSQDLVSTLTNFANKLNRQRGFPKGIENVVVKD